jgi:hypothetical protein
LTQEILERNDSQEKSAVSLGDGTMVSMQMVQDVYNEITGKTENISKSYRLHHKTSLVDIEQLNIKIRQLYEQYNIIENNCNVTLYHVDDCKEVYSSFERFKIGDKSSLSSVENIRLQYNFLILLPKTNRPQSYKIEVDIHSRAAISQKASKEHGMTRRIMHIVASRTAVLEIEYIDYTVARNFRTAIDSWFNGLEQSKESKALNFIQDNSQNISIITRYLSALFICAYFFNQSSNWLTSLSSIEHLFKIAVVAFGTVFIVSGIAGRFGTEIGRSIDSVQPLSFLNITRGDQKAISELEDGNKKNWRKSFINIALTIVINIFSAWLAYNVGIGI